MCMGSSPPPPAVLPEAPRLPDQPEGTSGDADKRRRAAASGASGTILTGSRGVTQPGATATKTLLGE